MTMLKRDVKQLTLNLFYWNSFFRLVQTLCNLIPGASSVFDVWCQKLKRPWRRVWTLRLPSRLPLTQGLRVLFRMWIIWKIDTVILFKRNMAEKDVCRIPTFCSLVNTRFVLWFFFLYGLFTTLITLKLKKNK